MELTPNESKLLEKAVREPLVRHNPLVIAAGDRARSQQLPDIDTDLPLLVGDDHFSVGAGNPCQMLPMEKLSIPEVSAKPMVKVWDSILGRSVEVSVAMAEAMEYVDRVRSARVRTRVVKPDFSVGLMKDHSSGVEPSWDVPFYRHVMLAVPPPPGKYVVFENLGATGCRGDVPAAAYPTCYGATAEDRLCASLVKTGGTVGVLTPKE